MKKINIYSSFPVLEIGHYFSKRAINPLVFKKKLDDKNFLPIKAGLPKHFLLKIEHELALRGNVEVFSSLLDEEDYAPIYEIADKYKAIINFIYLETSMENLYEMYKRKKGTYEFVEFCDLYAESFSIPSKNINKLFFEQVK